MLIWDELTFKLNLISLKNTKWKVVQLLKIIGEYHHPNLAHLWFCQRFVANSVNILLIYFTMNCINSLLTLFLLLLQCHTQNSAPLQLSKNAYMASGINHLILGRYSISLTGFTSAVFQDNFFTTPFVNTIYNIAQVYYSTAEMDAETYGPYYPDTFLNFIWY
jgi:hypothetical protein